MGENYVIGGYPHQAMDLEANADYIYIAALNPSTPVVLKMASDLESDATEEYNPGSGDYIGLVCGDEAGEIVWAAGDFGTDKVVWFSSPDASYWDVVDPSGWLGDIKPIHLGPSDDKLVMIGRPLEDILYESYWIADCGPYWLNLNNGDMPFDFRAIDRLDVDKTRIIIGVDIDDPLWVDNYWYPRVEFSPSTGNYWADITKTLREEVDVSVTSVIYG